MWQDIDSSAVPKPRPGVFRITKNIHNTLQGVSEPGVFISDEDKQSIVDWVVDNAKRYWLSEGGPLRPVEEGGAHVVVVSIDGREGLFCLDHNANWCSRID